MTMSLRSPQGIFDVATRLKAALTKLNEATVEWQQSGPPTLWLHFEGVFKAEEALSKLIGEIKGEPDTTKTLLGQGLTMEDIWHKSRGSWGKKQAAQPDMTVDPPPAAKANRKGSKKKK